VSLIRLQVPGSLEFRDLAVRVVAAACKLVSAGPSAPTQRGQGDESRSEFDNQVISAFGEAFNNAAIHSYRGRPLGTVEIEIEIEPQRITLRICDYGVSFDPTAVEAPDLDSMPESGMGLFIMRSFMDSVFYKAGAPNVLSMTKQLHPEAGAQEGGAP
jgi:serine/threonine-protein kinase RsbW